MTPPTYYYPTSDESDHDRCGSDSCAGDCPEYVCIFGSREGVPDDVVRAKVRALPPHVQLVNGGAPGVDLVAFEEALRTGRPILVLFAQWDDYGDSAGPIRNGGLVKYSHRGEGVRVPGRSPGTDNCEKQFKAAGKPVVVDVVQRVAVKQAVLAMEQD